MIKERSYFCPELVPVSECMKLDALFCLVLTVEFGHLERLIYIDLVYTGVFCRTQFIQKISSANLHVHVCRFLFQFLEV